MEKSFYTLSSSKNLTVVGRWFLLSSGRDVWSMFNVSVPPLSAPIITGGRDYYTEVGLHDGSVEFHFFSGLVWFSHKKNTLFFLFTGLIPINFMSPGRSDRAHLHVQHVPAGRQTHLDRQRQGGWGEGDVIYNNSLALWLWKPFFPIAKIIEALFQIDSVSLRNQKSSAHENTSHFSWRWTELEVFGDKHLI